MLVVRKNATRWCRWDLKKQSEPLGFASFYECVATVKCSVVRFVVVVQCTEEYNV